MSTASAQGAVKPWGNSLGLRLTKAVASAAGITDGTVVRISAEPGRIVIEASPARPSLDDMLARFDPKRHGGEALASKPVGREIV